MRSDQREQLHKLLAAQEAELTGKGRARLEPNRRSEDEVGTDEDEQPLNEMLQSIASNRNRNTEQMLVRVRKALAKWKAEADELGLCEECGEEIPFPRLRAMPYAEFCVACQGKRDGPKSGPTRKKITDYQ